MMTIIVVNKDILPAIAAQHDMVNAAVFVKPGFACHGRFDILDR